MINIKLFSPVYLEHQLQSIIDAFHDVGIDYEMDFIKDIARGCYIVRALNDITLIDKDTTLFKPDLASDHKILKNGDCHIGANAILHMMSLAGIETEDKYDPISEVDIPADVFHVSSKTEWYDISLLASRVEQRTQRFYKMIQLNVPVIILGNEYRMTYDAVNTLCCNGYGDTEPLTHESGCVIRSLSDIGYDLINGWNDDMRKYLEQEEQKYNINEGDNNE